MNELRVLPLPKVDARYGQIGGKYPETIRVAMSDGKVITYRIEIEQPSFLESLKVIQRMRDREIGYEAK